ncbi:MAG: efflux RND transporter periplasmic adaptor subunit [Myxococcaceae bacterium]
MMRFNFPGAVPAALVLLCGGAAFAVEAELPTRSVKLAPVGVGDVVEAVELVGELQGIEEVRVFAQVPERIRRLAVKEGDPVKAGDLLVVMTGDMQTQGVLQAQAALDAALVGRDGVQDTLKRTRGLVKAGAITASQLEQVESQARGADAQVRQATAAVGLASAQRSRMAITSPIDGVVSGLNLREGDLAAPGFPILTVVRTDRLKAMLRVPERHFLKVALGMPVRLSPLARPDVSVATTLALKSPVVDRLTRTGLVEVYLDNQAGQLVAGSAVRATIELSRKKDAVLVPASALLFTTETERTGRAIAFVAEGTLAKKRDVKIASRQGGSLEVVEGLAPGEKLVVLGGHLLRDGNPIRVEEPNPAKPGDAK